MNHTANRCTSRQDAFCLLIDMGRQSGGYRNTRPWSVPSRICTGVLPLCLGTALLPAVVTVACGVLAIVWFRALVRVRRDPPPEVSSFNIDRHGAIPPARLRQLGYERFPGTVEIRPKEEIGARFLHLSGRVGWFFGRRPEFYFPQLPLSWSMVGTLVFLPPLAVYWAVFAGRVLLRLLDHLTK